MKQLLSNRKILLGGIAALVLIVLAIVGIQAACHLTAPDAQEPTKDPDAVLTAVMQTAEAMRMETASVVPVTPTNTGSSPTPSQAATSTVNLTPSATSTLGSTAPPGGLRVVFVADVTIPDGTILAPNTAFTKTWRLRNGGTVTWTPAFSLVFTSGEKMAPSDQVPLLANVAPGAEIDISVAMVSPAAAGRYQSNWMMRDPNGQPFGVDPEAKYPIYVDIVVSGTANTPVPTTSPTPGTPVASPSPTVAGAQVTNVTLAVDNTNATSCPNTFSFTASFSLSRASAVTYRLEASASDPSITITVPPPVNTNLEGGLHTVVYTLTFTSSIEGTARFRVTAPQEVVSNQVAFKLTCSP